MIATFGSKQELQARICQDSFYFFLQQFWDVIIKEKPIWNWHIKYLCDEVQQVTERVMSNQPKEYDLIINLPPGETKSTIISVMLPIWTWTKMPSFKTIVSTHTYNPLGLNLSRLSRDIVRSAKFQDWFGNLQLRSDQDTKGYYINDKGGWRLVSTVGGVSPLGLHAHLLVVDDPIDPKDARGVSQKQLTEVNDWITQDLSGRKVDKAVTASILLMQRLNEIDPSGFYLRKVKESEEKYRIEQELVAVNNPDVINVEDDSKEKGILGKGSGGRVKHICLPADLSDGYPVVPSSLEKRYTDGLLDNKRLTRKVLGEYKSLGEYTYAAQYGQQPVPPQGGMFKVDKLKIGDPPPESRFKIISRFWDKAATSGQGDYTAGVKIGITQALDSDDKADEEVWVLHVERGQWDVEVREATILRTAIADGRRIRIGQEREGGSGGKESAKATTKRLRGFAVEEIIASQRGSKIAWAEAFATQVNSGCVTLARGPWNQDYIDELKLFWFGAYDDQVDGSSGAFQICTDMEFSLMDWIDRAF